MNSFDISIPAIPNTLKPSRPYRLIPLYWNTDRGLNGEGEGGLATRRQLQTEIAQFLHGSPGVTTLGLAPGAVVQLTDGLYWLSQDWQVLCL